MSRGLAVLAAALFLAGCQALRPEGGPVRVRGEEQRVGALLERARREADGRTSLRALATLRLRAPDRTGKVKEVIVAARPARLRLESLDWLGQTRAVLVTDGERYAFSEGRALERGAVTPDVLARRLGLDLEPGEAVAALLATALGESRPPDAVYGLGDERWVDVASHRVHFGADGELRGVVALDAGGEVRWSVAYAGWRDVPGGRYPREIVLEFPRSRVRAELEIETAELNPVLSAELFRLGGGA